MESVFKIAAVILAGIAAYFLWQGNGERAFITAVFGAVSFFLSVCFQVKARIKQREAEEATIEEEDYDESAQLSDNLDSIDGFNNGQRTTDDGQKTSL